VADATLLSLLIPAVGGQGGGVLMEWIVEAATLEGLTAHGTSIPGVAQRTGSTTYYVEVAAGDGDGEPAFSLYPIPGALDVLLAPEFLEVGRMIELGFVVPSRTTVIASTHRLYSIHEKIATGRAIYPQDDLARGARAAARALIAFDALAVAREHRTEANAVLLGALAGSGVLPIGADAFRRAIAAKGVMVEANLRGFDVGVSLAATPREPAGPAEARLRPAAPAPAIPAALGAEVEAMPAPVAEIARHAVARLIDYQDVGYAKEYLARLAPFLPGPGAPAAQTTLACEVARWLAVLMTYEDAVRVAQLKTRASRFARIRADARAPGAEIVVTDFLKPDLDELYGVLPRRLVAPFARWAERRWPHGRPTLGQHVRTTTVTGFLRVRLLALLRPLRRVSWRAHHEHARIARWLDAVRRAAGRDLALACEVARAAQLVKGYGDVRRRLGTVFDHLLAGVERAAELEASRGRTFAVSTALARRWRAFVLDGPEGEARAAATAAQALERLERADPDGALAALAER
jgi:indolepyruvate ferredoxin oxidoreductase beta subunit